MEEEFKDFEMEGPSLTLEPDLGEFEKKEEPVKVEQPQPKEEAPALTPAEQQMVNEFAAKIDIVFFKNFCSSEIFCNEVADCFFLSKHLLLVLNYSTNL